MLTMKKLEEMAVKDHKICMTTACVLPSGAVEIITNYDRLDEKFEYLINAYDDNLRLKTMKDIKLLDCMVICKSDL